MSNLVAKESQRAERSSIKTVSFRNEAHRFFGIGARKSPALYAKIMDTSGGLDTLMNSANEMVGYSSSQMQNALTSQIDKVTQKPTARNVGQLNATVQAASNQANASVGQSNATTQAATNQTNTSINQADVAESLKGKGILSQKINTLAGAIAARVNGQQITKTQGSILNFELGSSAVQSVISEFMQKKANGVDSAQSNVYDRKKVARGVETGEVPELWDLAYQKESGDRSGVPGMPGENDVILEKTLPTTQRLDLTSEANTFGDNDYTAAMEDSPPHQVQQAVSDGSYKGGSRTRTFREATQQDADLIFGIKTRYNAGKTRNAASAKGTINGKSIALECISGKFSHDNYYNKGNFEPPQPENYHYHGPIPEYTNHTEQKNSGIFKGTV